MKRSEIFILILDALLRPSRFAAFLAGGPRSIAQAGLATLLVLGMTFGVLVLGLGQILMLDPRGLLAGLLLGPVVALLFAGFYVIGQDTSSLSAGVAFAVMRPLIAITLPISLLLAAGFSITFADRQVAQFLSVLTLVFLGIISGGTTVIVLMQKPRRTQVVATRLVLTAGTLAVGAAIWLSPTLRQTDVVLAAPVCAGLAAGFARPLSYLWEAPLSLVLVLAARLGVPARRLLALHPVRYDDLCVLPLPGLAWLLMRAWAADTATGGAGLLQVAQHPGQSCAARRAVERIVRNGVDAHRVLFWLSTRPAGVAFLQKLAEQPTRSQRLVGAYSALAQVMVPEAWSRVIDQQRAALVSAAGLPGGVAILAFLEASAAALRADRWSAVVAPLRTALDCADEQPVQLRAAVESLRSWVDADLATPIERRMCLLRKAQDDLEGWPAALLGAVGEHLVFLAHTEQRRIAELVAAAGHDHRQADRPLDTDKTTRQEGGQPSRASLISRLASASRSLPPPARPTADDYDTLKIHISRAGSGEYFQVTLHQPGTNFLGGPFRPGELITTAAVREIRPGYEQQVAFLHELRWAGMSVAPPDEQELVRLGRRIAGLLPPMALHGIVGAVLRARHQRRGLRVLLEVAPDARDMLGVPWELMVLPLAHGPRAATGEGFLLLNADVTLVRQVQGVGRNTEPDLPRPFTCQVIAAAPVDGQPIDLESTRAAIAAGLLAEESESYWYAGTDTLGMLQECLRSKNPDMLHLLCHGEQSDTGRGLRSDLLFVHRDGYTQRINAFDLAPIMTLAPNLQVVVLQACYTGLVDAPTPATGERERLSIESIALTLVRHGLPAVVAMQGEVGQDAADAFVRTLYAALKQGQSLDKAVAAGRIAIRAIGGIVDWSLPVLYQGSGQPESETWYTRLADALSSQLDKPSTARTLRGSMVVLALLLFMIGSARWLLEPTRNAPNFDALLVPLEIWAGVGIVGPAIIAAAHRGVRDRSDLSAEVRRAARQAQWTGAYLGYALGGLIGLLLIAVLWMTGLLMVLASVGMLMFGIVLLGALFYSYVTARTQIRSALAIAPNDPTLFNLRTTLLIIIAVLFLIAVPFGIFWLPGSPLNFLLDPAPAAIGLATVLLLVVLGLND